MSSKLATMTPAPPLPRAFWFLWAGMLVNRLGGFIVPFLALYLTEERGLPVEQAGLIVTLWGAGSLLSGPFGGHLADSIGRRKTLGLGTLLGAAAMLSLGFARTPMALGIGAFALGFLGDMFRPAINATVADVVPEEQRPRAYGIMYWAYNLGFSIAPLVAGLAMGRGQGGFVWLFVGDAATTLACGAILWTNVPESRPTPTHDAPRLPKERARAFLTPYRDWTFLAFAVSAFLAALVFHQGFVALPVDMGKHGISPVMFGRLIACNGILIVLVQPFVSGRLQRMRPARVLAAAALLMGIGFGLSGIAASPWAYLASIAVWTFGEILMAPVTPTVVAALAPASLRGTYQGAFQFSWGGATLIGPVLGAVVLGRLGAPVLWWGCVVVGVLSAMVCLALGPAFARRGLYDARGAIDTPHAQGDEQSIVAGPRRPGASRS